MAGTRVTENGHAGACLSERRGQRKATAGDAHVRASERIDTLAIVALVLVCVSYAFPRWADWNQNSRFDLVVAMVDEGTLSIDCCVGNTGDYALFEGRTYSDKAPGLSFLAVPPYALWRAIARFGLEAATQRLAHGDAVHGTLRAGGTGIRDDKMRFAAGLTVATFFTVAVPAALGAGLMFRFLAAFSARRAHRVAVTLVYALGTIAFAYSNVFYAHQLVAVLLFAAFVASCGLTRPDRRARRLVVVGALLGVALISEYPAALIVAALIGYAAWQLRRARALTPSAAVWLLLGMLPPLLACAAYHLAIFHTPWPVAYRYSALWQERHAVGFMSIALPDASALWGITFSPFRGLFLISPVLLLSLAGLWYLWQRREWRAAAAVSAAAVGSFLAFNSASIMWWGGFAIGPRYLVPMLPFLAWPLIAFLERHAAATWARWLFGSLALLSLVFTWSLTLAGQHFPEDSYRFPLLEYAWPQWWQGNVARNVGTVLGLPGWWSLAPLVGAMAMLGGTWWALARR